MFKIMGEQPNMKFGAKVRATRIERNMTHQVMARRMSVSVSYISKIENERPHFGDYAPDKFIHKSADELETDEDELLVLADKVPVEIRKKIWQHPSLFPAVAGLDEKEIEHLAE